MKRFLQIALGILSAIGGFVDIGDLVFNTQAGATFGFQLMWVVVIGVVGIIVYSEMCGRVAAISKRPVFDLGAAVGGRRERRRPRHAHPVVEAARLEQISAGCAALRRTSAPSSWRDRARRSAARRARKRTRSKQQPT